MGALTGVADGIGSVEVVQAPEAALGSLSRNDFTRRPLQVCGGLREKLSWMITSLRLPSYTDCCPAGALRMTPLELEVHVA